MPIYEYRCQDCDKVSEVFVRSGKEPSDCEDCGGTLTRLISKAGIIFKGSGFYVTDSKSSKASASSSTSSNGSSESASNGKSSDSTSTSSESKSTTSTATSTTKPSSSSD